MTIEFYIGFDMVKAKKGNTEDRKNLDDLEVVKLIILQNAGLHKRVLDKISAIRRENSENFSDRSKKIDEAQKNIPKKKSK